MPTRLRLSCRVLLITVLVGPNFHPARCLATVQFSSPFTLTEFINGLQALALLLGYRSYWRSQKFNDSRISYVFFVCINMYSY